MPCIYGEPNADPISLLPPLDDATLAELRARYNVINNADLRLRYQMILLARQGRNVAEMARITFRSHYMVERVLERFCRWWSGGGATSLCPWLGVPTLTPAWTAELLRVIELNRRIRSAWTARIWTTGLLATYLADQTGLWPSATSNRCAPALHAHDATSCKRPTWTLKRQSRESSLATWEIA